jgi:opacity protein-like surface antigen
MLSSRKIPFILLSSFLFFCSEVSMATLEQGQSPLPDWVGRPLLSLTGGAAFISDVGQSKNFPALNPIEDSYYDYHAHQWNQTLALVGGFLGTEYLVHPDWRIQVGVSYNHPSTFYTKGLLTQGPVIVDTGAPDVEASDQYTYGFSIQSHQILAESKLLYNWEERYHPYVMVGLGASINRAFDYNVNISPPFTTLSNQFGAYNNAAFSYSVGVGMDIDMMQFMRLGVGYRFTDFGQVQTGPGVIGTAGFNNDGVYNPAVVTSNKLTQPHLYTNEVVAQLTFLLF